MRVVVWPDKFPKGFTGKNLDDVDLFPIVDLVEALETRYESDAVFVPYIIEGEEQIPRLRTDSLQVIEDEGARLRFGVVVLDIDAPGHKEVSADWKADQIAKLNRLPVEFSDFALYWTRGGYRVIFLLWDYVELREFLAIRANFVRLFASVQIEVDDLKDWTRCYRLPFVIRDGVAQVGPLELSNLAKLEKDEVESVLLNANDASVFAGIDRTRPALQIPEEIPHGQRNRFFVSLAGKLRNIGFVESEIFQACDLIRKRIASDWQQDPGELERIAEYAAQYKAPTMQESLLPAAPDDPSDAPFRLGSEVEIARRAVDQLSPTMVFDRAQLWKYEDAGLWKVVDPALVYNLIGSWDGEWVYSGVDKSGDPKLRPLKIGSNTQENALKIVHRSQAKAGFFNDARSGLNFSNGFVSVDDSGTVGRSEFAPDHRATAGFDFDFIPGAMPSRFFKMLSDCFQNDDDQGEKIELLREFIGAALLGRSTQYQKALILLGDGANGKSTVLEVISALFTDDLVTAIPPQEMGQEYRRAMLAGARLNVVNEFPEADILDSTAVKAILDGNKIVGRFIKEAPFSYRPVAGHAFAANDLPAVRDLSRGFWRRWLVLEFGFEFKEENAERDIAKKVIANERALIASWAIEGAAALIARGHYAEPLSAKRALAAWRYGVDVVMRFAEERCTKTESADTSAASLYNAFIGFCQNAGHRQLSSTKFGLRLSRLGIEKKKKRDGIFYALALRLRVVNGGDNG